MIPTSQLKPVRNKDEIRRLLFDAARSLPEAQSWFALHVEDAELLEILFEIALIDAAESIRLQACYHITQFPEHLLRNYEDSLLRLQAEAWENIADQAIVALAKIRSKRGLAFLIEKRLSPKLPWETKMLRLHLQDVLKE
jgi:hypothetical protein